MTREEAKDIRAQLEKLGLSQRAGAVQLGIAERTMRRYCSGEASVPRSIFMTLHLFELAQKDETHRKWLAEHGVKLAYVRPDGTDVDITKQEDARLSERAAAYRNHAKKLTKTKR